MDLVNVINIYTGYISYSGSLKAGEGNSLLA